jgi:hypothetical protein
VSQPVQIGVPPWTAQQLAEGLEEFAAIYARRPIQDNSGGMSSTHLFLFWSAMRLLKPKAVIESGVWKGQGTWLIEQACPDAAIHCIDINWSNLAYRSDRARYHSVDFDKIDWSGLPKAETLVFFDDHRNAPLRCEQVRRHGFRHVLFEDNYYPKSVADFYTMKLAFSGEGYDAPRKLRAIVGRLIGTRSDHTVRPNTKDAGRLREILDVYCEMPPVFQLPVTRWGMPWDGRLPTPDPLLHDVREPWQQVYWEEAKAYTWFCYAALKSSGQTN